MSSSAAIHTPGDVLPDGFLNFVYVYLPILRIQSDCVAPESVSDFVVGSEMALHRPVSSHSNCRKGLGNARFDLGHVVTLGEKAEYQKTGSLYPLESHR